MSNQIEEIFENQVQPLFLIITNSIALGNNMKSTFFPACAYTSVLLLSTTNSVTNAASVTGRRQGLQWNAQQLPELAPQQQQQPTVVQPPLQPVQQQQLPTITNNNDQLASQCTWCTYEEISEVIGGSYWSPPSISKLKATIALAQQSLAQDFNTDDKWFNTPLDRTYFDANTSPTSPIATFQPFTRRVVVPPDTRIIVWGDVHGSYRALRKSLSDISSTHSDPCLDRRTLKLNDNCRLLFLGDTVDRGAHSIEV